jgi:hypothetical protein
VRDHIYFANTIRSQISEATRAADGSVSLIDADDGAVLVVVGLCAQKGSRGSPAVEVGLGPAHLHLVPRRTAPTSRLLQQRTPSLATFMWPDD